MALFRSEALKAPKTRKETNKKYRILVVDGEQENLIALRDLLGEAYYVETAQDGEEAMDFLKDRPIEAVHLIICNQNMGRMDGIDLLEKSLGLCPRARRIMLTGHAGGDVLAEAINRAKVHAVAPKPVDHDAFMTTVRNCMEALEIEDENARLIQDLRSLNANLERMVESKTRDLREAMLRLETMATTDQLTGAYNRRKFEEVLRGEISRSNRYNMPLGLILFDIDNFKRVNDNHGHAMGDEVIREVANLVRRNIRRSDSLVRWGGEEFVILAPQSSLADVGGLAEKLRKILAENKIKKVGRVTASFGVAIYHFTEVADSFLKRGDDALAHAKKSGRNRVVDESELDHA